MINISLSSSLILASASPRREELLRRAGLQFKILPARIDETYLAGETPRAHVRRLSRDKASAIAAKHPRALVLGADTIVVIDDLVLGKPRDKKQAREMLTRLSGRRHIVFTGFTIVHPSGTCKTRVVQSSVYFKAISREEMEWYINGNEPYDKAGGYAVQGRGASFIKAIRGSYTNVIGLPLCEVLEELSDSNVLHFR